MTSIFDDIEVIQPCVCHIDDLLKHRGCRCGSDYGRWDDDMCRICESIHCECSYDPWDQHHAVKQWQRRQARRKATLI